MRVTESPLSSCPTTAGQSPRAPNETNTANLENDVSSGEVPPDLDPAELASGSQGSSGGTGSLTSEESELAAFRRLLEDGHSITDLSDEGESLISLACSSGYLELAQVLLGMRAASVDERGKGDCTPLMEAAMAGHVQIVQLLLQHGADVNAQSSSGNTPLMFACCNGHEEVVEVLLAAGANLEDHNENGHTPLMEAASAGHVNVAKILLQHGASINTHSSEFKESALTLACYKGHLPMVKFLLENGANQEHKTEEMHTALMEASMDGHVEVARLLLDSGAQVNMPADSFESPLTLAACGGHVELAMLLLERGANIEEVNDEGYTPLMEAAREGHEEMVALLLSQGAEISAQTDETQETALTLACCGGFLDVVDFLVTAGADLELGSSKPLMEAAQEGHARLVRYLIDAGANVHAQSSTGDTALTYACENGHTAVAEILVNAGADVEHLSEGGRTPLMKAARAGHVEVCAYLLQNGASINRTTTNNDHTPLSLACAGGHLAVVELLLQHGADPYHRLKDNSTMVIEAAKGGHTHVVQLLIDFPNSVLVTPPPPPQICDDGSGGGTGVVVAPPSQNGTPTAAGDAVRIPPRRRRAETAPTQEPDSETEEDDDEEDEEDDDEEDDEGGEYQDEEEEEEEDDEEEELGELADEDEEEEEEDEDDEEEEEEDDDDVDNSDEDEYEEPPAKIPADASNALGGNADRPRQHFRPRASAKARARMRQNAKRAGDIPMLFAARKAAATMPAAIGATAAQGDPNAPKPVPVLAPVAPGPAPAAAATMVLGVSAAADRAGSVGSEADLLDPEGRRTGTAKLVAGERKKVIVAKRPSAGKTDASASQQAGPVVDASTGTTATPSSANAATNTTQSAGVGWGWVAMEGPPPFQLPSVPPRTGSGDEKDENAEAVGYQWNKQLSAYVNRLMTFPTDFPPTPPGLVSLQPVLASNGAQAASSHWVAAAANAPPGVATTAHHLTFVHDSPSIEVTPDEARRYKEELLQGLQMVEQELQAKNLKALTAQAQQHQQELSNIVRNQANRPLPQPRGTQANKKTAEPKPSAARGKTTKAVEKKPVPATEKKQTQTTPEDDELREDVQGAGVGNPPPPSKKEQRVPHTHHHHHPHPHAHMHSPSHCSGSTTSCPASNGSTQAQPNGPYLDLDSETDSNHDTALTLACAGGHDDLTKLLISRGADIEHRDKKGFTPLILAATAGHAAVVQTLLEAGADIEAQSERTKDTPLSLACSGGRIEVVEILLNRSANKEHRNVSDYTPLSLAASGGYVNIIKLLLENGAEINSRTGSKLGISPLMLAAMNGHVGAVKLLLEKGSDINAQIETNRNTALTLACFQGRHEVVSLLLDYKANIEHRAKTGLTPLMEAASGGFVEVGAVLIEKGADVNAPPVPSSRDTALTIAADKGHLRFVELLLQKGAQVDVRNKKGSSPLWLAANGGHLEVLQALAGAGADLDAQDNRRVTPLMAAFRRGHHKVVRWMVRHVTQFPSDQELSRFLATVTDKDLMKKCNQCFEIIAAAKEKQAAEANKNANILLEQLEAEQSREEHKKAAAARRRQKKKNKKKGKNNDDDDNAKAAGDAGSGDNDDGEDEDEEDYPPVAAVVPPPPASISPPPEEDKENQAATKPNKKAKKKQKMNNNNSSTANNNIVVDAKKKDESPLPDSCISTDNSDSNNGGKKKKNKQQDKAFQEKSKDQETPRAEEKPQPKADEKPKRDEPKQEKKIKEQAPEPPKDLKEERKKQKKKEQAADKAKENGPFAPSQVIENISPVKESASKTMPAVSPPAGSKQQTAAQRKEEEEWKEVVRTNLARPKKVLVPANAISRVIGRAGCNINRIREISGAHIEVEKQGKSQTDRTISIKGSAENSKQAVTLITALINNPDKELNELLAKLLPAATATTTKAAAVPAKPTVTATTSAVSGITSTTSVTAKSGVRPVSSTTSTTSVQASKPAAVPAAPIPPGGAWGSSVPNSPKRGAPATAVGGPPRMTGKPVVSSSSSQSFSATVGDRKPSTGSMTAAALVASGLSKAPGAPSKIGSVGPRREDAGEDHVAAKQPEEFNPFGRNIFTEVASKTIWNRDDASGAPGAIGRSGSADGSSQNSSGSGARATPKNFASVAATGLPPAPTPGPIGSMPVRDNMHQVDANKAPGYRGGASASGSSTTTPSSQAIGSSSSSTQVSPVGDAGTMGMDGRSMGGMMNPARPTSAPGTPVPQQPQTSVSIPMIPTSCMNHQQQAPIGTGIRGLHTPPPMMSDSYEASMRGAYNNMRNAAMHRPLMGNQPMSRPGGGMSDPSLAPGGPLSSSSHMLLQTVNNTPGSSPIKAPGGMNMNMNMNINMNMDKNQPTSMASSLNLRFPPASPMKGKDDHDSNVSPPSVSSSQSMNGLVRDWSKENPMDHERGQPPPSTSVTGMGYSHQSGQTDVMSRQNLMPMYPPGFKMPPRSSGNVMANSMQNRGMNAEATVSYSTLNAARPPGLGLLGQAGPGPVSRPVMSMAQAGHMMNTMGMPPMGNRPPQFMPNQPPPPVAPPVMSKLNPNAPDFSVKPSPMQGYPGGPSSMAAASASSRLHISNQQFSRPPPMQHSDVNPPLRRTPPSFSGPGPVGMQMDGSMMRGGETGNRPLPIGSERAKRNLSAYVPGMGMGNDHPLGGPAGDGNDRNWGAIGGPIRHGPPRDIPEWLSCTNGPVGVSAEFAENISNLEQISHMVQVRQQGHRGGGQDNNTGAGGGLMGYPNGGLMSALSGNASLNDLVNADLMQQGFGHHGHGPSHHHMPQMGPEAGSHVQGSMGMDKPAMWGQWN